MGDSRQDPVVFDALDPLLDPAEPVRSTWLISFSDLICLVLCMFIMMYATVRLPQERWQAIVGAVAEKPIEGAPPRDASAIFRQVEPRAVALRYLAPVIASKLGSDPVLSGTLLFRGVDRLVLQVPQDLLFTPGSTDLSPAADAVIAALMDLVRLSGNRVEVAGYAGLAPALGAEAQATAWTLSLARAEAAAAALEQAGLGHKVTARGYGAARVDQLAPSLPQAERERLTRRIDLVIREEGWPDAAP
ncbi:OmpA family protein [Zavarzinia sp. CC-PAN008]|uniref:OmpA family protein n=1 Tax=Zavarzinia sp. CC-PAN008 TaxID=3243332 RepID=UPI003F7426B2